MPWATITLFWIPGNNDLPIISITAEKVRKICNRNFGLGADGILIGSKDDSGKYFNLQIFNPDGSTAEKKRQRPANFRTFSLGPKAS